MDAPMAVCGYAFHCLKDSYASKEQLACEAIRLEHELYVEMGS